MSDSYIRDLNESLIYLCKKGYSPMTEVSFQTLVSLGANFNYVDEEGLSPLFHALLLKDSELLILLCKYGANPSIKNECGLSILDIFYQDEIYDMIDRLGYPRVRTNLRTVEDIINLDAPTSPTLPLVNSSPSPSSSSLYSLLSSISTVHTSYANSCSSSSISSDLLRNEITVTEYINYVDCLMDYKNPLKTYLSFNYDNMDINVKDSKELTFVMKAAITNNKDALQVLIESGADINIKSAPDTTALLLAIYNGSFDCIEILLDNNVDTDYINNSDLAEYMLATNFPIKLRTAISEYIKRNA